ncbi:cfs1-like protein [Datura stramonium]|uniref:Cfs1-like protein n=1 Tax=Datura stramonium TaxID=4076 RepID=A0ABS8TGR0_DATST|nr:cfs1-like protein [Datura stramonium]
MTYSCAIFESEDEDLKANISAEHHILEIGFGWGSLAIEAVKQTGCKYTGITLSEQQLKYAQLRVEQAGLQDQITFLLCMTIAKSQIRTNMTGISCGMLEHVGYDFIREFFACCESALAEDGLLVLQAELRLHKRVYIPRWMFACTKSSNISHGCCIRLCVEHLEEIGIHYYQTLRCWRKNFLENKRTWEYYFDYCAAGFKTCTIGDYQIVFSRPGNVAIFGDPYNYTPSAYYRVSYQSSKLKPTG